MIHFNQVSKIYPGGARALDAADLHINQGEFVFLTGPNGSGKTTVLKLLYLNETVDEGELSFAFGNEHRYHSSEAMPRKKVQLLRRHLGIVFQDFKLLFDRNVFENIALALRVAHTPEDRLRLRVQEVLALTGLSDKALCLPQELSSGEQQRVAIARAVANNPYVILADEPTANLDPDASREVLRILEDIHRSGATVIMATHDEPLIQHLPHRRIRLEWGKVVAPHSPFDELTVSGLEPG
jgi:cell division transport system ATP-binding protein